MKGSVLKIKKQFKQIEFYEVEFTDSLQCDDSCERIIFGRHTNQISYIDNINMEINKKKLNKTISIQFAYIYNLKPYVCTLVITQTHLR